MTVGSVRGSKAKKPTIPVGLVFSLTGSYRTVGEELLNGALLAIEEINDLPGIDFQFLPKIENPGGDLNEYRVRCVYLLRAESMNQRVSVEDLSELIACNGEIELNRLAIRNKGSWRQVNRR